MMQIRNDYSFFPYRNEKQRYAANRIIITADTGKTDRAEQPEKKETSLSAVSGAASAFKDLFPFRIMNKWQEVREKIKVNVSAALKKFSREREAFGALSDWGTRPDNKKEEQEKLPKSLTGAAEKKEEELTGQMLSGSHLMDSYSRSGKYCQLSEHITFQNRY